VKRRQPATLMAMFSLASAWVATRIALPIQIRGGTAAGGRSM